MKWTRFFSFIIYKLYKSLLSFRLHLLIQIVCDAMCDMLMSITDESLLNKIESECAAISKGMVSFPLMIPGTLYYKGIKVELCRFIFSTSF